MKTSLKVFVLGISFFAQSTEDKEKLIKQINEFSVQKEPVGYITIVGNPYSVGSDLDEPKKAQKYSGYKIKPKDMMFKIAIASATSQTDAFDYLSLPQEIPYKKIKELQDGDVVTLKTLRSKQSIRLEVNNVHFSKDKTTFQEHLKKILSNQKKTVTLK